MPAKNKKIMRKVYLLLTSAMLLIGSSSLWAGNQAKVDDTEYATIYEAITNWTSGSTLTILEDCEYSTGATDVSVDKSLDLNGHTFTWITSDNYALWLDSNATLTVEDNSGSGSGHFAILVDASVEVALGIVLGYPIGGVNTKGTFVARNCTLSFSSPKATTREFVISQYNSKVELFNCTINANSELFLYNVYGDANIDDCTINASDITNHGICQLRGNVNLSGTTKILANTPGNTGAVALLGSDSPSDSNYTVFTMGPKVTVSNPNYWGVVVNNTANKHAYGVVANIDGTIEAQSCMTISGNIQDYTGNIPVINIHDGTTLKGRIGGDDEKQGGKSIYAAGYGIWNVGKATLIANNPIHAKAGIINLNGTTITATRDFYSPITYYGNGGEPTGNAIAIESNPGYAGNIAININNGATIVSKSGYALEEGIVCKEGKDCKNTTNQICLTVIDGENAVNAFSGAKGTMSFSDDFAQALNDGVIGEPTSEDIKWVQNAITGGKYSAMPEVVADGYMVAFTGDVMFPYEVVLKNDDPGITDITSITEDRVIEGDFTVEQGKALIVRTGKTLEIQGKLNIGQNVNWPSQVTVEPGATLIVKDGIEVKASNADNALVLKADSENGTGSLLYSGAAPVALAKGTVELYMYAKDNGDGTYTWQHFGLPVMNAPTPAISKTAAAMYNDWDNGWKPSNSAAIIAKGPWYGYNTTTNAPDKGAMFKFTGAIVGNENADFYLERYGYYCFANSYTSRLSIKNLVNTVNANDQTDGSVWVYDASKTPAHFDIYYQAEVDDDDFVDGGLAPMQAFFVKNDKGASTSITLNYINDVYKFIPNSGDTRASDADLNGGKITLSDGKEAATLTIREAARYSDEIEKGSDVVQMETGMIQIYALQGEYKLSAIATNNIDSKEIEILTKGETEYTLTFSNIKGNGFKLTDLASGAEIEVGEGKTYSFTAAANSTIRRFKLGEGEVSANETEANSAVNIWAADGNVFVANNEAAANIEIYNLSGVKVAGATANGEALQSVAINSLASGVYIVRVGEASAKVVK